MEENDNMMPEYVDSGGVLSRFLNPSEHENQELANQKWFTDYQNQFNEYMWQKSADWNSVGSQLQRAQDAGVNPNYVLGFSSNQQMNPIQSASPTIPSTMSVTGTDAANSANALLGGLNHGAQAVNGLIDALFKPKMNNKQLEQMNSIIHKNLADAGLSRIETKKVSKLLQPMYEKLLAEKDQAIAGVDQIYTLIDKYQAEIRNLEKTNELIDAQTGETKEKRRLYAAQAFEKELQNVFREKFGIADGDRALSMLVKLVLNGKGDQVTKMLSEFIDTFSGSLPDFGKSLTGSGLSLLLGKNPFHSDFNLIDGLDNLVGLGPWGLSNRLMKKARIAMFGRD